MARSRKLDKQQLLDLYPDQEWRASFLRLLNIAALLKRSVIRKDYRVPDDLNNAIYLTDAGSAIAQSLITKHDVPAKDAKMMCFLTLVYREPLVDVERTNYRVLLDEVSKQLLNGDIKHPFVFGRQLYDRAAELFPDERDYLSVVDTARLLDGLPAGVWQVENLITGPFGIIDSGNRRGLPPRTEVPLQHCSDRTCHQVHYVALTTDYEAPVNAHRYKLSRLLEGAGQEPSDWDGFIDEVVQDLIDPESDDDLSPSGITFLLGDGLVEEELRILLSYLLDNTGGELRKYLVPFKLTGAAEQIAASMDRARLMQIIMCCDDAVIVKALNHLVADGKLVIPRGEIRRARTNHMERFGSWGLRAELSALGARFTSMRSGVPLLRLRRLVDDLYDANVLTDMHDLGWSLRRVEGLTAGTKLADYLRSASPEEVITTLVLSRREKAERAVQILSLEVDLNDLSDHQFVAIMLWKLGFRESTSETPHQQFERHQDEVVQLVRAALLSATSDEEPIRKASSVYWSDLEYLLSDSLQYSAWALTTDHFTSERPYTFRPSIDGPPMMDFLNAIQGVAPNAGADAVKFSEDSTLYPLVRGFSILADHLEDLQEKAALHERPVAMLPRFVTRTRLKQFPFLHTVPFLDLKADAQREIIGVLRDVSLRLLRHDVPAVRNSLSHFRRTTIEMASVLAALEDVRGAASSLAAAGLMRIPYTRMGTVIDEWGRQTVKLGSPGGQTVSFTRPSAFDWLGLPPLGDEQYLMHSARFADPNEVFRFRLAYDSPYEDLWSNYPLRRERASKNVAKQSEPSEGLTDREAHSRTRSG